MATMMVILFGTRVWRMTVVFVFVVLVMGKGKVKVKGGEVEVEKHRLDVRVKVGGVQLSVFRVRGLRRVGGILRLLRGTL
jgi:hypothetical protein